MRVVLDANILVSALLIRTGYPAAIYRAWHEGRFGLLTCAEQLDELRVRCLNQLLPCTSSLILPADKRGLLAPTRKSGSNS